MLALGHGPLALPPVLAQARRTTPRSAIGRRRRTSRSATRPGPLICVGAGIAAVNEWANALDVGASMISLLRSPEPDEQDLNAPRCLFEAYGIDAYPGFRSTSGWSFSARSSKGTTRGAGTGRRSRGGRPGGGPVRAADGRDRHRRAAARVRVHITAQRRRTWLARRHRGRCATGFQKSSLTVPLVRRIVEQYRVPVEAGRHQAADQLRASRTRSPESRLCMMGILANDVVPHGDTIAGTEVHRTPLRRRLREGRALRTRSVRSNGSACSCRWPGGKPSMSARRDPGAVA